MGNTSAISSIGNPVQKAIAFASNKTGIDFDYLLGQAQVESGMRADARAPTSSATGLYQFIDQSWLGVVKQHGAEHGLGWAADAIRQSGSHFSVDDAATRQAILNLRSDPKTAALMAAEHAADNKTALESSLGRPATGTDLYMAHFLGLGGARSFLSAMESAPGRTGAAMFPAAARANRNVFYASNGQPRTLSQIYDRFAQKLDNGASAVGATGLASDTLDTGNRLPGGNGVQVVLGSRAIGGDRDWVQTTLAMLDAPERSASLTTADAQTGAMRPTAAAYRPTPDTARLAYMLLASLGA